MKSFVIFECDDPYFLRVFYDHVSGLYYAGTAGCKMFSKDWDRIESFIESKKLLG